MSFPYSKSWREKRVKIPRNERTKLMRYIDIALQIFAISTLVWAVIAIFVSAPTSIILFLLGESIIMYIISLMPYQKKRKDE